MNLPPKQTKCPACNTNPANYDPSFGVLPCDSCQSRRRQNKLPQLYEVITETLRRDRKEHAKSIIQPYRNGQVSKEWIETYGTKGIKASKEEIKNAKYQWKDIHSESFDYSKSK